MYIIQVESAAHIAEKVEGFYRIFRPGEMLQRDFHHLPLAPLQVDERGAVGRVQEFYQGPVVVVDIERKSAALAAGDSARMEGETQGAV